MQDRKISEEELIKICYDAVDYAVSHVAMGFTQFAKESKETSEQSLFAKTGITYVRQIAKDPDILRVEPDDEVNRHDQMVKLSQKYSLGNCAELAWLTFLYIFEKAPQLTTSILSIAEGDHIFAMTNLPPSYDVNQPKTLKSAIVVDAWGAWTLIRQLDDLPKENFESYERQYIWISSSSDLYYCYNGKFELVPVKDKIKLKEDLDVLLKDQDSRLMHPALVKKIITNNGGHRPNGMVYHAAYLKKDLKNYLAYYVGIRKIKFESSKKEITFSDIKKQEIILQKIDKEKILAHYMVKDILQSVEIDKKDLNLFSFDFFDNKTQLDFKTYPEIVKEVTAKCPGAIPAKIQHKIEDLQSHQYLVELTNSKFLRSKQHKAVLVDVFFEKIAILESAIKEFISDIKKINESPDEEVNKFLADKIVLATNELIKLNSLKSKFASLSKEHYLHIKTLTQDSLSNHLEALNKIDHFNSDQLKLMEKNKLDRKVKIARIKLRDTAMQLKLAPQILLQNKDSFIQKIKKLF
jgi:hypothetical protein